MPSSRSLPPLNAIKAFEASGRHLSFTKAAEELGVTPAAVSHQVRGLEDLLGLILFRRLPRALVLTPAGRQALPHLSEGLDRLSEGISLLKKSEESGELRVTMPTTFAGRWLVPRLHRFQALRPDIKVRIDATNEPIDLLGGEADIAIRYGSGDYPGLECEGLTSGEALSPVCSPDLLKGPHPLREPADLAHQTLLHLEVEHLRFGWPTWEMWLKAAGVDGDFACRGPVFAQHDLAISAAVAGQGVVLAGQFFLDEDLKAQRLVVPFELKISTDFGYWIVAPADALARPKVAAFREWLLEEIDR